MIGYEICKTDADIGITMRRSGAPPRRRRRHVTARDGARAPCRTTRQRGSISHLLAPTPTPDSTTSRLQDRPLPLGMIVIAATPRRRSPGKMEHYLDDIDRRWSHPATGHVKMSTPSSARWKRGAMTIRLACCALERTACAPNIDDLVQQGRTMARRCTKDVDLMYKDLISFGEDR